MNDALLAALDGRHAEALAAIGPDEEPAGPPTDLDRARDHVRAHALAGLGDSEAAKACLLRLAKRHGRLALERAALVAGPASPIAQAIQRGEDGPYR
jgi:hypothetical protein